MVKISIIAIGLGLLNYFLLHSTTVWIITGILFVLAIITEWIKVSKKDKEKRKKLGLE